MEGGGAAAPDEPPQNDESVVLEVVLARLRTMANDAGEPVERAIQMDKVRIALEATGGDVELAVTLYWDDYLATRLDNDEAAAAAPPQQPQAAAAGGRNRRSVGWADGGGDNVNRGGGGGGAAGIRANNNNNPFGAIQRMLNADPPAGADGDARSRRRRRRQQHRQEQEEQLQLRPPPARRPDIIGSNDDEDDDNEDKIIIEPSRNSRAPTRRSVSRRLDRDFDRQQQQQQRPAARPRNQNPAAAAAANDARVARLYAQARETVRLLNPNHRVRAMAGAMLDQQPAAAAAAAAPGAEVSEDEDGVWRKMASALSGKKRRGKQKAKKVAAASGAGGGGGGGDDESSSDDDDDMGVNPDQQDSNDAVGRRSRRKKKRRKLNDDEKAQGDDDEAAKKPAAMEIDESQEGQEEPQPALLPDEEEDLYEDGYISDSDWLWDTLAASSTNNSGNNNDSPARQQLFSPMDLLWGGTSVKRDGSPSVLEAKLPKRCKKKGRRKDEDSEDEAEDDETHVVSVLIAGDQDEEEEGEKQPPSAVKSDDDADDPVVGKATPKRKAGIPRTWLSASFSLDELKEHEEEEDASSGSSEKKNPANIGLVLQPPTKDDLAYFAWQRQATGSGPMRNNNGDNKTNMAPFHCRGISGVLSIVTALLHANIAVHGNHIVTACSPLPEASGDPEPGQEWFPLFLPPNLGRSGRQQQQNNSINKSNWKPWASLTPEERRRQFETRLANALAALLVIAAQSSQDLKRRSIQKQLEETKNKSKSASHSRSDDMWQRMERKLAHLVRTCSWEIQDASTGEVRIPEGARDADRDLQVAASLTNVLDLKAYVLSNMRSFTSTGGVALFLETIARIHGRGAILRMMQQARKATAGRCSSSSSFCALVNCQCEARHEKRSQQQQQMNQAAMLAGRVASASKKVVLPPTADSTHECFSTELLSLLLTGRVHTSLQGWTTGPLGIGMLSTATRAPLTAASKNELVLVGKGLSRPEKPIWILRGPSSFSVLSLRGTRDLASSKNSVSEISKAGSMFAKLDRPGAVAQLVHFSCWYNQRHETKLRLVQPQNYDKKPIAGNDENKAQSNKDEEEELGHTMRLLLQRRQARQQAVRDSLDVETVDPSQVVSMDEMERLIVNPDDQSFYPDKHHLWRYDFLDDKQQQARQWKPYFRLTERERLIVESKLGPQIVPILLTRWPRATVDKLEPQSPAPVV